MNNINRYDSKEQEDLEEFQMKSNLENFLTPEYQMDLPGCEFKIYFYFNQVEMKK